MRRRALLAAAAAAAGPAATARAELRGSSAFGSQGWIFPTWEDIRRVDLQRTRQVCGFIVRAAQELRRHEIETVFTLAPTRTRIYADMLPPEFRPSPEAERRYAVALEELRRGSSVVPDLAALLTALRQSQPQPVFFRADSHWTSVAAEAAATETARLMRSALQLPPSAQPGLRLGAAEPRTQDNDLLGDVPLAEQHRWPAERYQGHRFTAPGPGALIEAEGGDVAIVGNSYMQAPLGFPPMLSNQLDRPVVLFWQTARFGPYRTLLDYLASPAFARSRPRALVWHFNEGSMEKPCDDAGWWAQNAMPPLQFMAELRRLAAAR
jgi:alginate O-acetyltransferase complex protein AlgJ